MRERYRRKFSIWKVFYVKRKFSCYFFVLVGISNFKVFGFEKQQLTWHWSIFRENRRLFHVKNNLIFSFINYWYFLLIFFGSSNIIIFIWNIPEKSSFFVFLVEFYPKNVKSLFLPMTWTPENATYFKRRQFYSLIQRTSKMDTSKVAFFILFHFCVQYPNKLSQQTT